MKTLLHTCCGPCASACVPVLKDLRREVTMLFANSNIDTREEFDKRLREAEKLAAVQRGSILDEERELASLVEGKVAVSDRRQSELGKPELFDSSFITPQKYGYDDAFMHEVMMGLGKLRTSEPVPRDRNLVQAIRNLDDQIATINLYNERLHEWYGMHFPELADYAHDEKYADLGPATALYSPHWHKKAMTALSRPMMNPS